MSLFKCGGLYSAYGKYFVIEDPYEKKVLSNTHLVYIVTGHDSIKMQQCILHTVALFEKSCKGPIILKS